jgi:hypothetical protein
MASESKPMPGASTDGEAELLRFLDDVLAAQAADDERGVALLLRELTLLTAEVKLSSLLAQLGRALDV